MKTFLSSAIAGRSVRNSSCTNALTDDRFRVRLHVVLTNVRHLNNTVAWKKKTNWKTVVITTENTRSFRCADKSNGGWRATRAAPVSRPRVVRVESRRLASAPRPLLRHVWHANITKPAAPLNVYGRIQHRIVDPVARNLYRWQRDWYGERHDVCTRVRCETISYNVWVCVCACFRDSI